MTNHATPTIGRPRVPASEKAETKSITLRPAEWAVLAEADPDGSATREAVRRLRATIGCATRLTYDLADLHELRAAKGKSIGGFATISCQDDQGRKAEIITNSVGEGLFWWSDREGCYKQSLGTCQFSIYGWSDQRARRELRKTWEEKYEDGKD